MGMQSAVQRVQMVVTYDAGVACDTLFQEYETEHSAGRLIVRVHFTPLPSASKQHEVVLLQLMDTAFRLWPNWYGGELDLEKFSHLAILQQQDLLARFTTAKGVSHSWLLAALDCCCHGRVPQVPQFQELEQIRQLALALGPDLTLILCCADADTPGERLLGMARMVEQLVRQAEVRVVVIVPPSLASAKELDSINYACRNLQDQSSVQDCDSQDFRSSNNIAQDEPLKSCSALRGRPHPESPGEQKLALWLARDAQLAEMFKFNEPVRTTRGSRYLVDLLWPAGSLVVEVDGYRTHTTPHQFRLDRQRDYELTLSGYVVLRLTHAEVMQDVVLAGEKIRDLVNMRSWKSAVNS